ncbi:Longin domain [Trinorchestia longiramus]|nr:Longin domain [Trinorchestia longiramus]
MEGYATMLHDAEKERKENLLDWVACASDIDESAMEDEQDGGWKTTRNSWKKKEKPVEEITRDVSLDSYVAAAKKLIKILVPKLVQYPKRVCLQDDAYTVHCVHSTVVAFIAVCEPTFSHLLVHSYLDELSKEFSILYNSSVISAVRRPYAFTEFGMSIY